jgi:hypothetical protein
MAVISSKVGDRAQGALNNVEDVALVQAMLRVIQDKKGHPYLSSNYDGSCGGHTIDAIKAFQVDQSTAPLPQAVSRAISAVGIPAISSSTLPNPRSSGVGIPALNVATLPTRSSAVGIPALTFPRPNSSPNIPALASDLDEYGTIKPGGATMRKLNELLPASHKAIRTARGGHLVYWPGSAADAANSIAAIQASDEFQADFRKTLADLVRKMFDAHELVLSVAPKGGRRTFQEQYNTYYDPKHPNATDAGPGESNHNFGQAVDIGFEGIKWMWGNGNPVIDSSALDQLQAHRDPWFAEMWKIRNSIAIDQLGLFPSRKKDDLIHLQKFDDKKVSMGKSLVALLNKVGAMKWKFHSGYQCDLGLGGEYHNVGDAVDIWDGSGPMEKKWIADGKKIKVDAVTDSDVAKMRAALRGEFDKAEAKADEWTDVPK